MTESSDSDEDAGGRFYSRYRGATVAATVTAVVGFIAIVTSPTYGDDVALRIGNSIGALVFFGAAAFLVGWGLTRLSRTYSRGQASGGGSAATDFKSRTRPEASTPGRSGDERSYTLHLDQLDRIVRDAANQHWPYGNYVSAVESAARAVNAALQARLGSRQFSENDLINKAFSDQPPRPNDARLRFSGRQSTKDLEQSYEWRSRAWHGLLLRYTKYCCT